MRKVRKTYQLFNSYEERVEEWKLTRKEYANWRQSPEGLSFIHRRRKQQCNLCFLCLKPLEGLVHIDHSFPLWLGGTNSKANMVITHPKCNMDKGSSVPMTYRETTRRRGYLKDLATGKKLVEQKAKKLSKKGLKRVMKYKRHFGV